MNKTVKLTLGAISFLVIAGCGSLVWAFSAAQAKMVPGKFTAVEGHDVPVPWPLSEAELQALRDERAAATAPAEGATPATTATPAEGSAAEPSDPLSGVDLEALAMERALARGKHLLAARVGCLDCHAEDGSGSVIIDAPPMGKWVAPNITTGKGGRTASYTNADWERTIRHGVGPDHRGLSMPSRDFVGLSDQEVSDIIAVLRTLPPKDVEQPPTELGPIFALLIAKGDIPIDAESIPHGATHPALPPEAKPDAVFGKHLALACTGCHGANFAGGAVPGGDPSWPPSGNLTPHATGLEAWSLDDFKTALREGRRPDGRTLDPSMPWKAIGKMTDIEIEALYVYLKSLPPVPMGER